MNRHAFALAAALLPGSMLPVAAADFRVTAVYGSGERLGALVELEGEIKSIRAGDIVGGTAIAAVVPEGVEVEHDGERLLVPLGGGSATRIPRTALARTAQVRLAPLEELVPALKAVEQSLQEVSEGPAAHAAVAQALGLPEQARIVAIRRQDFDGPKEALRKIRKALARRDWPQITVENVEGLHEVYIEPADAGGPMP